MLEEEHCPIQFSLALWLTITVLDLPKSPHNVQGTVPTLCLLPSDSGSDVLA